MGFFDKYLYLFDYWSADLLKPFEDEFFTNARERIYYDASYQKVKCIEFQREDGVRISFLFNMRRHVEDRLRIHFELSTDKEDPRADLINDCYYFYYQKGKLKEIISHLQEKIKEIKKTLHEKEGQRLRFLMGMELFDDKPNLLEEHLQEILNTTEETYAVLKSRRERTK